MEFTLAFLTGGLVSLVLSLILYRVLNKNQTAQFKVMAQEILHHNSQQFLEPFDKRLKDYYDFIHDSQKTDVKERQSIKEQIEFMIKSAQKIEAETHQLTRALSSDVKFQGDWGELILERVLELAGLQKGQEFFTQNNFESEGKNLRPDVLIKLPNNLHLIIDSKVSLKSYFQYIDHEDEKGARELKQSMKTHIDSLAKKDYQLLEGTGVPDFVYMFIPVEGIYSVILKEFPELIEEALRKNIIIVSPINLLANLKTVSALWRVDKQAKGAVEIAHKAGAMYDKFSLLIDDINKLQTHFKRVDSTFEDIHKRLHSGKGNLVDRAQELKDFGARTSKDITH